MTGGKDMNPIVRNPFLETFYMPEGKLPKTYGVLGAEIPESFIGQLIWPFRKENQPKKRPGIKPKPEARIP